jgi:hypothetical protein
MSIHKATLANLHNNLPAVFWNWKGSTTMEGPANYLLRLQSLHARQYCYIPWHNYIPGSFNCMADEASWRTSFKAEQLLNLFDVHFPQQRPWQLCCLQPKMNSVLISALFKKPSTPASWTSKPALPPLTGDYGWDSVPSLAWMPGSSLVMTIFCTSKFSHLGTVYYS